MMEFDFKVFEDLDKVPEKYRPLYSEISEGDDTGKFAVGEQFKGIVADYTGTSKALTTARADKKTSSDESAKRRVALKTFDSLMDTLGLEEDSRDAAGLQTYISDISDKAKNGAELKINLDKVRAEMEKKNSEQLKGKDDEISGMTAALSKHLIGDVAKSAIADAKGSRALLMPIITGSTKMVKADDGSYAVRVIDDDGEVRFNSGGEPMTVTQLVDSMKGEKEFAQAFESDVTSGTGQKPGSAARTTSTIVTRKREDRSAVEKIAGGLAARTKR